MKKPARDLYRVLHVERTATGDDIRRAYRRLLRDLHPDLRPAQSSEDTAQARRRLQAVMDAYAVLGEPARRMEYDRTTANQQRPDTRLLVGWTPLRHSRETLHQQGDRPPLIPRDALAYWLRRTFLG